MQCVVLKRIDENLYPTHWRQTCALMGLHHEVRQLISNIIQKSSSSQFDFFSSSHDLSQSNISERLALKQKWYDPWITLLIRLILIHLLAVSHRFKQLHCKSDVQKHFSNDLYAFWMIFITTWFRLTTWGAGSPVELETFIITTRSNQPHSWAWESCETKTR